MKAFYVILVVFAVLLLGAPLASAQDGSPGCPWGAAYDPMMMLRYGPECLSRPATAESIASKTAGLAAPVRVEKQDQGWPGCSWGATYNPTEHGFIAECFWQPADNAAAIKPAGLAKPAPAVIPVQGLPCLLWGDAYDPTTMLSHGPECMSQPADNSAASKTAGLAKLTPVEGFVSCGAGEILDPLMDAQALACLSQSVPTAKAASKPAGLAAPVPVQEQFGPCGSSGESPDPLVWPQACLR